MKKKKISLLERQGSLHFMRFSFYFSTTGTRCQSKDASFDVLLHNGKRFNVFIACPGMNRGGGARSLVVVVFFFWIFLIKDYNDHKWPVYKKFIYLRKKGNGLIILLYKRSKIMSHGQAGTTSMGDDWSSSPSVVLLAGVSTFFSSSSNPCTNMS